MNTVIEYTVFKLTSPSTIPCNTAGRRGWNIWEPNIGLTLMAISTTCKRQREREWIDHCRTKIP